MVGLSIASAGAGLAGQIVQANQTNKLYEQNAAAANSAAATSYAFTQNRDVQERQAAEQQLFENSLKGLKARGQVLNAAGEAGVGGLSVDALAGDYAATEGRNADTIVANYAMNHDYLNGQMASTEAQTQNRINSAPRASVGPLDVLSAGIKAASGSLNAFTLSSRTSLRANGPYGLEVS